jgi:hypothetical protein
MSVYCVVLQVKKYVSDHLSDYKNWANALMAL